MYAFPSDGPRRAGASALVLLATLTAPASGQRVASVPESPRGTGTPLALTALAAALPQEAGTAVDRRMAEIVSKEVAVGRNEATLVLELGDGQALEIRFQDGRVHVDDEDVGPFDSRLDTAWRELLGRAVALDDGPLARALVAWEVPEEVEGDAAAVWERIDTALDDALEQEIAHDARPSSGDDEGVVALGRLLGRTERLGAIALALSDLDVDDVRISVDEDVVVEEDERVDATLLVIDGDVDVRGEVTEHVVVVGGTVRTFEGSRIGGDVRLTDGRLVRSGGAIAGIVRESEGASFEAESMEVRLEEARRRAEEAEERAREAAERIEGRMADRHDGGFLSPFRSVARSISSSIAGIVQTFMMFVVLSVLGGLAVLFGRSNLEVVAETVRRSPGRAAAVGMAGAFLTLPLWILGAVALVVTIVGIPVAIAWLPLFPVAVALAAAFGYFAVAHNAGEWLARQRYPYLRWVRSSNPYTLVAGGMVGLLAAFFLAHAMTLFGPWLEFLRGMLIAAGVIVTVGAALVGFGAVLLTRAGRRPEYYRPPSDPFADGWDWDPTPPPSPSGPAGTGTRPSDSPTGTAGSAGATGATGPAGTAASGSAGGAKGEASGTKARPSGDAAGTGPADGSNGGTGPGTPPPSSGGGDDDTA